MKKKQLPSPTSSLTSRIASSNRITKIVDSYCELARLVEMQSHHMMAEGIEFDWEAFTDWLAQSLMDAVVIPSQPVFSEALDRLKAAQKLQG